MTEVRLGVLVTHNKGVTLASEDLDGIHRNWLDIDGVILNDREVVSLDIEREVWVARQRN